MALFLYPHIITGTLASKRRSIVKRNLSLLPAYSILLGLIALFGYMAITDPVTAANVKKSGNAQLAVPYLFQHMFPSWFAGIAFAGIIIGALVPAAIMAIAAANLFTRNIFKEFFKPDASPALQTRMSQWASLVVKIGALVFAVELPHTFSINLQLLGGVWILQVLPMLVGGLYTRWFHRWALLAGWLAGMIYGTIAAYNVKTATTSHWAASSDIVFGHTVYIGLDRAHHQRRRHGGADADPQGRQGPRGRRRDTPPPVHSRRRAGARSRRPGSGSAAHRTSCRGRGGRRPPAGGMGGRAGPPCGGSPGGRPPSGGPGVGPGS